MGWPIFWVVDAGAAGIHYDKNIDQPIHYDTILDRQKTKSYHLFSFLFSFNVIFARKTAFFQKKIKLLLWGHPRCFKWTKPSRKSKPPNRVLGLARVLRERIIARSLRSNKRAAVAWRRAPWLISLSTIVRYYTPENQSNYVNSLQDASIE